MKAVFMESRLLALVIAILAALELADKHRLQASAGARVRIRTHS